MNENFIRSTDEAVAALETVLETARLYRRIRVDEKGAVETVVGEGEWRAEEHPDVAPSAAWFLYRRVRRAKPPYLWRVSGTSKTFTDADALEGYLRCYDRRGHPRPSVTRYVRDSEEVK